MTLKYILRLFRKKLFSLKAGFKSEFRSAQFNRTLARIPNFSLAIKETLAIEGAIVEAGVGSGLSLATLALLKQVFCPQRPIFAFDSFRTFPPGYAPGQGKGLTDDISGLCYVKENLLLAGVDPSDIVFVEGYFSDTMGSYSGGPIAVLHLDVDIGRSYTDALEGFWPHVALGGVVIFDEYDSPTDLEKWPDAKPAIDAFFRDKSFEVMEQPFLTRRVIVRR